MLKVSINLVPHVTENMQVHLYIFYIALNDFTNNKKTLKYFEKQAWHVGCILNFYIFSNLKGKKYKNTESCCDSLNRKQITRFKILFFYINILFFNVLSLIFSWSSFFFFSLVTEVLCNLVHSKSILSIQCNKKWSRSFYFFIIFFPFIS